MTSKLVLASASPRRREMLERVGVPIEVRPADVDETPHAGEDPRAYVARIADTKRAAISADFVLAADTTVTIDGKILGKAADDREAAEMLRLLSGRVHQVITAFALTGAPTRTVATDVEITQLDDATIAAYVASGEWRGKAGAYAIQGIAAAFVVGVRGSVTNVIGLPLAEVLAALRDAGAPGANLANGIAS
ncbi:MAG TPA: nucleoside triphosphate pyrophosphatase [Kofleriaceae bacterium]